MDDSVPTIDAPDISARAAWSNGEFRLAVSTVAHPDTPKAATTTIISFIGFILLSCGTAACTPSGSRQEIAK
jgi:hypothetical protein